MERLVLRLLNEAMVCLRERIVDGPDAALMRLDTVQARLRKYPKESYSYTALY